MKILVGRIRLLLLGLWLGAAVFFGTAVAPTVFSVLRETQLANANEIAGMIVQRSLAIVNRGGFEIGLFLLVTGYFINKERTKLAQFAEMISVAIMVIMTGLSHWMISARMVALKAGMHGPIDQIAANDSRRIAFDALHWYSVTAMGVAIVAGLSAFLIMARLEYAD